MPPITPDLSAVHVLASTFAADLLRLVRAEHERAERLQADARISEIARVTAKVRAEERTRVLGHLGKRIRDAVDIAVSDGEESWCIELRTAFDEYEAAIRLGEPAPNT